LITDFNISRNEIRKILKCLSARDYTGFDNVVESMNVLVPFWGDSLRT
jgi:hypothetical protein